MQTEELLEGEWYRVSPLDCGQFSIVYKLRNSRDNKIYAGKIVNKNYSDKVRFIKKEIVIHKKLSHPNIVELIANLETDIHIVHVLEFCSSGSLGYLWKKVKNFKECKVKNMFSQVISGLEYMHEQNIVHRDLKLDNILLEKNDDKTRGTYQVKICDFGFAAEIGKEEIFIDVGTPIFQAEECFGGGDSFYSKFRLFNEDIRKDLENTDEYLAYKKKCFGIDVWSLGICIYSCLFKKYPFDAKNRQELNVKIRNLNYSLPINEVSEDAKDLIAKIFVKSGDRIDLNGVKYTPFFYPLK